MTNKNSENVTCEKLTNMFDGLDECPFCGGKAKLQIHKFRRIGNGAFENGIRVKCTNCTACPYPSSMCNTRDKAVMLWNNRAHKQRNHELETFIESHGLEVPK